MTENVTSDDLHDNNNDFASVKYYEDVNIGGFPALRDIAAANDHIVTGVKMPSLPLANGLIQDHKDQQEIWFNGTNTKYYDMNERRNVEVFEFTDLLDVLVEIGYTTQDIVMSHGKRIHYSSYTIKNLKKNKSGSCFFFFPQVHLGFFF